MRQTYERSLCTSESQNKNKEVSYMKDTEEVKVCIQCDKPVMPGEEYCEECIIEDAKTMGVIE